MNRRNVLKCGVSLSLYTLAGCTGSGSNDVKDSDGDGMIDSKDYAPNDPEVKKKSDLKKSTTQILTPTPTPTPTETTKTTTTTTRTTTTTTTTTLKDSDHDGVADVLDDYPDNYDFSEKVNEESGTELVDPGHYRWWKWTLESPATFSFEIDVVSGSHVDGILIDESQFDEFEAGNEYTYYTNGSDFETKYADKHLELRSGSYRFIVSNWNTGSDEQAKVEYYIVNAR